MSNLEMKLLAARLREVTLNAYDFIAVELRKGADALDSQQAQIDALVRGRDELRAYAELKQRDYDEILSKWRALKEENQRLRGALMVVPCSCNRTKFLPMIHTKECAGVIAHATALAPSKQA